MKGLFINVMIVLAWALHCQDHKHIAGTFWAVRVADTSDTWIAFREDSTYCMWDDELEERIYGSYSLRGDSIVLTEEKTKPNNESIKPEQRDTAPRRWPIVNGVMGPGFQWVRDLAPADSVLWKNKQK